MKRVKMLYLLVVLFSVNGCSDKTKESKGRTSASETVEVQDAVTRLNNAIINPTEDALAKIVADGLSYGHSSGLVQDKDEFIEDLVHGSFDFDSIDISDQTVQISGDVAVVRQVFDSEASNDGTPVHVHIGIVLIFQKQNGQWKLLARQAYKL